MNSIKWSNFVADPFIITLTVFSNLCNVPKSTANSVGQKSLSSCLLSPHMGGMAKSATL